MAVQLSPVTPSVLRWAVDEDGRNREDLADSLRVGVDVLDAWLSGEQLPTKGEVTDLAKALKRPRAVFFLPQPPTAVSLPPNFRHPPGDERLVSANTRKWVRRARRVQQGVSWARRDQEPVDMPRASLGGSPAQAAAEARSWLGVTLAEQQGWKDERDALRAWREALEERGLLVFAVQIGTGEVRGFSAWDERAPLIVANTSRVNPGARIFTLGHELGHLVTRSDAACLDADQANLGAGTIERWCEEFAANLLMPRRAVLEFAMSRGLGGRMPDLEDVKALQKMFRVSGRAAARRLVELGYADESFYAGVDRAFQPSPPDPNAQIFSRPKPELRVSQYGPGTIRTIMEGLPTLDALSLLRIDVGDAREIAELVPGVPVP